MQQQEEEANNQSKDDSYEEIEYFNDDVTCTLIGIGLVTITIGGISTGATIFPETRGISSRISISIEGESNNDFPDSIEEILIGYDDLKGSFR